MNELLIGAAGSGKTTHCVERCLAVLRAGGDPVALVPNYEEAIQLRRRLLAASGRGALFLPGIQRFQDLAHGILDRGLPGWEPRPPLIRRLKLQEILQEIDLGPLQGSAATRGFIELLDRFLGELDDGELTPDRILDLSTRVSGGSASRRLEVLAEIHSRLRRDQESGLSLDPRTILRRACSFLESDPTAVFEGGDLLVMDGFSNFTPLQARFIEALLPVVKRCCLAICLDPADLELPEPRAPFERLHRLATGFKNRTDWDVVPLAGTHRFKSPTLEHLATHLFRDTVPPPAADGGLKLLQGATPLDEVEGVVSRVRGELTGGTSPGRIAILFRDRKYGGLLREALEREGIPFQGLVDTDLSRQPLTAVVSGLLRSLEPGGEPRLLELLRGGVVDTDQRQLAELEREVRGGQIPGPAGWGDLYHGLRQRLGGDDEQWDWLRWQAASPPVDKPLSAHRWLGQVLRPLLDLLKSNLSAAAATAVSGEEILCHDLHFIRQDLLALRNLEQVGEGLQADGGDAEITVAGWNRLLRFHLEFEKSAFHTGREGGGILLGNPFEIRLPELDAVFICGLNEGSFPPAHGERPLLRERERELLLNEPLVDGFIPGRADRQAEERYLFYIAMTRASQRVMLSCALEDGRGRSLSPSFFLEEVRTTLGDLPDAELSPRRTLEGKIVTPLFARQLQQGILLGEQDPRVAPLAAEAREYLANWPEWACPSLTLSGSDEQSPSAGPDLKVHAAGQDRFSPSRLEKYADCPFHYLCRYLLDLSPVEDGGGGPLEEGSLYHRVLQDFYSRPLTEILPLADRPAELRRLLVELQELAVGEMIGEYPSMGTPRFAVESSRRLERLQGFLKSDLNRITLTGLAPSPETLETGWALEYAPEDGGAPFTVTGRIDRIDGNEDGDLLVLDYKRGDPRVQFPADYRQLTSFQLDLYLAAVTANGGRPLGSAYLPLGERRLRGFFRSPWRSVLREYSISTKSNWLDDQEWSTRGVAVRRRVEECVTAIRAGSFPVTPADQKSCDNCPFGRICRRDMGRLPLLTDALQRGGVAGE